MFKKCLLSVLLLTGLSAIGWAEPMELVYYLSSGHNVVGLPLYGTVACTVNWGDGSSPETILTAGDHYHTFPTGFSYTCTLSVTGTVTQFGKGSGVYTGRDRLVSVESFGDIGLTSLTGAFAHADMLTSVPAALPATVTDLSFAFYSCGRQTIANLDAWDVGNVTDMTRMFAGATDFNQDIGSWDVGSVTDMTAMFMNTDGFNRDIGGWDVSSVSVMTDMFFDATVFDQNLGSWDVSGVTDMSRMFYLATLSVVNYDSLLIGWEANGVQDSVLFHGGYSKYSSASEAARQRLADTHGWTVTDGGKTNFMPVLTSATIDTAFEDVPFTYIATAMDPDGTPVISYPGGYVPSWLTVSGDTLSGTPVEGTGDTSFIISVTDGENQDQIRITLKVIPVNDPPVIISTTVDSAIEDIRYSYVCSVADPDNVPVVMYTGYPAWLTVSGDSISGTPGAGTAGDVSFTVIASDGAAADTVTVQLHIQANDGALSIAGGTIAADETWSTDVVRVTGDVVIDNGVTLTIAPGTRVEFRGKYKIDVNGRLLAVGTAADSIRFYPADTAAGWLGIEFISTNVSNDTSVIEYCRLEGGRATGALFQNRIGGAVRCYYYSKVRLSHNALVGNRAREGGGAVYCYDASPVITHNLISGNAADSSNGGGIFCGTDASPVVAHNLIADNTALTSGGGIFCNSRSSPGIRYNRLRNNSAGGNGGAIYCNNSSEPAVVSNVITGNAAGYQGGGIYLFNGESMSILGNEISGNHADYQGGACYSRQIRPSFQYNTFVSNTAGNEGDGIFLYFSDAGIYYNIFFESGLTYDPFDSSPRQGSNTSTDPLFTDAAGGDYTLLSGSSCIDNGGSGTSGLPEFDAGGNPRISGARTDRGAYEFQNLPPAVTSAAADTATGGEAFTYVATATDPDGTPVITFADYPGWMTVTGDTVNGVPPVDATDTLFTVIASDGYLADTVTVQLHVVQVSAIDVSVPVQGQNAFVPVRSFNLYGGAAAERGTGIIIELDAAGNIIKRLRLKP